MSFTLAMTSSRVWSGTLLTPGVSHITASRPGALGCKMGSYSSDCSESTWKFYSAFTISTEGRMKLLKLFWQPLSQGKSTAMALICSAPNAVWEGRGLFWVSHHVYSPNGDTKAQEWALNPCIPYWTIWIQIQLWPKHMLGANR